MASSPQHEPTMEEILASIRKIISEDAAETTTPPAAPAPAVTSATPDADVLELTQELPEETVPLPPPVRIASPPPPKPESSLVLRTVEESPVLANTAPATDDIFSDKTRKALDDTFATIPAETPEVPMEARDAAPSFGDTQGHSVEAVFERAIAGAVDPLLHGWMDKNKAELLAAVKPLIREWMDEHFPALLEGAVRNEVERVVKARGNKR